MGGIVTDAGLGVEEFKKLLEAPLWRNRWTRQTQDTDTYEVAG